VPFSPNTSILLSARPAPFKRTVRRWLRYHQQTVMVVAVTGVVAATAVAATVGLVSTIGERIPLSSGAPAILTTLR